MRLLLPLSPCALVSQTRLNLEVAHSTGGRRRRCGEVKVAQQRPQLSRFKSIHLDANQNPSHLGRLGFYRVYLSVSSR
jgi:hypothetical protein